MRQFLFIAIVLLGCAGKKDLKEISLPFEIVHPNEFYAKTKLDNHNVVELVEYIKGKLVSIDISIRDSVNPKLIRFFHVEGRYSYSSTYRTDGDSAISEFKDGISKGFEINGNLVWSIDEFNNEYSYRYYYKKDTLVQAIYSVVDTGLHLLLKTKFLFNKNHQMKYYSHSQGATHVYHYNQKNELIRIDELDKIGDVFSHKDFEYKNNFVRIVYHQLGESATETDSVYLDSKMRVIKRISRIEEIVPITQFVFYDSLDQLSIQMLRPNELKLAKAVLKK